MMLIKKEQSVEFGNKNNDALRSVLLAEDSYPSQADDSYPSQADDSYPSQADDSLIFQILS